MEITHVKRLRLIRFTIALPLSLAADPRLLHNLLRTSFGTDGVKISARTLSDELILSLETPIDAVTPVTVEREINRLVVLADASPMELADWESCRRRLAQYEALSPDSLNASTQLWGATVVRLAAEANLPCDQIDDRSFEIADEFEGKRHAYQVTLTGRGLIRTIMRLGAVPENNSAFLRGLLALNSSHGVRGVVSDDDQIALVHEGLQLPQDFFAQVRHEFGRPLSSFHKHASSFKKTKPEGPWALVIVGGIVGLALALAGDVLGSRPFASYVSTGLFAFGLLLLLTSPHRSLVAGLALLTLPLMLSSELGRRLGEWPVNPNWSPAMVVPGDLATPEDFPDTQIESIRGYWRGSGVARVLNADEVGGVTALEVTTNINDSWGEEIITSTGDIAAFYPWVEVQFPYVDELAGKTLHLEISLEITYPERVGDRKFRNETASVTHTTHVVMTSAEARRLYDLLYWGGLSGGYMLGAFILAAAGLREKR